MHIGLSSKTETVYYTKKLVFPCNWRTWRSL